MDIIHLFKEINQVFYFLHFCRVVKFDYALRLKINLGRFIFNIAQLVFYVTEILIWEPDVKMGIVLIDVKSLQVFGRLKGCLLLNLLFAKDYQTAFFKQVPNRSGGPQFPLMLLHDVSDFRQGSIMVIARRQDDQGYSSGSKTFVY